MAYQIVWSAEAENDFMTIVEYLKENWSLQTAERFIEQTVVKLDKIANSLFVPRYTSQEFVQIIKLDKKNALFFTIENENMILLSTYPYKKDITQSKYY